MVSFETNPYPHNAIKTICRERRKDGSCVSVISFNLSSSFPSFPFAWKGAIEKRKDRSDVSDFIFKGAAFYAERFVHLSIVLCISTENVKGACYISEIEDYLLPTYCICSPNAASEVQSYRFCHSWRVDALHIIVYKGMLTTKRIFCYKDSLISDKVLNIEVVKTVFLWKIRDFGIKCLPLHLQPPLASRWYSVHSGTFYKL